MKTQAINMPYASQAFCTRKENGNSAFKGGTYVVVPTETEGDTFVSWAAKNVVTASVFSLVWDLGTNFVSKFAKNVDAIPTKQILTNMPKVAGVFLLVGGIFRLVSNAIDNK